MMPAATHNGSQDSDDDLVLSGLAGRLPDCENMEEFAEKLFAGVDLVSADDRRWKPGLHGLPERNGKLKDLEHFDASFFGVHGKQAHLMDPQLRLLLEITHEAIVDAGYAPAELRGSDTGVFVGVSNSETEERWTEDPAKINGYALTGCCRAMFPNRISYTFDLQGPSYAVDTACSSSMFALAQAAAAIRAGHCSAAVVAGCNLCLKPANSLNFHRLSMLSPEGRCAAFDAAGRGYVRSEAAVCVLLQRRAHARRHYATLRAARCNTDGHKAQGITFPSGARQLALVRATFRDAGLRASDVAYVEAHGTGTKVGDPQEVNAIAEAFCTERSSPLLLGSVKSNMGHSEPASGLCSVAKVLLAAQRGELPANLHYRTPNPDIPALHDGRIQVVSKNTPWDGGLVAINSFGFGGANAHVILDVPRRDVTQRDVPRHDTTRGAADSDVPRLIIASGRTEAAVEHMLSHARGHASSRGLLALLDHAHYVNTPGHEHRGYALLGEGDSITAPIQEVSEGESSPRPVWFVFSGMGSQCAGVGRALAALPGAREALHDAHSALQPEGIDLMHLLTEAPETAFDDLINCFVGIAAVQVALVEVLKQVGVTPDGILGHSVGEIGCAYADGTLTVKQAVLAAYWRGRSIRDAALPPGAMCATGLSWEEAQRRTADTKLQPACHNSDTSVTISGPVADIDAFVSELTAEGIFARKVASAGVAFHSQYIAGCADALRASLAALIPQPRARSARWVSSSLPEDQWDTPLGRLSSMEYHVNNLLSPVRFAAALRHVPARALLVELAPHALLQAVLRRACTDAACVPLLRRDAPPLTHLLSAIGKLYCAGGQPKVGQLYGPAQLPAAPRTPGLGAAVRWDHATPWSVASFHKSRGSEWTSEVDVSRPEDAYLTGHKIDGRVLFPATGYMCLIWRGVCEAAGREWRETAVLLSDVTFHRATIVSPDAPLAFTLHALPGGRQELREGGTTVVTAEARIVEDPSAERLPDALFEATHNGVNGTDDWKPLDAEDIYKELRLRGYEYGGEFRGIERAECGGSRGTLAWRGNWVAFMDCMLQFGLVGSDVRGLYLPVRLQRALLDPGAHVPEGACRVHHAKALRATRAGGIELRGLKTSLAPRRAAPQPAPRLERYSFVPYCSNKPLAAEPGAARRLALQVCAQLLLENAGTLRLRVAERAEGRAAEALLLAGVLDALDGEPQVRAEASVWPTMELGALSERGVTARPAAPEDCHLVIAADALCRGGDKELRALAAMLHADGMLLLQEARDAVDLKQHRDTLRRAQLDLVARLPAVTCDLLLVRATRTLPSEVLTVAVSQQDYSWVEQLKSAMKRAETEDIRVLVVGSGSSCGVLGLGTCLRQEAGGARCRVFLSEHELDAATLRARSKLDLAVNVLRGTDWGCYRHLPLPLPSDTKLQVEHAYVNTVTRGDLSSLVWLESPLATHPNPSTLAKVHCAPLNFRDVMLATGKLPPDALPGSLATEDCILGLEWSGRLGSGERAMGLVPARGLATTVQPGHFTWRVPPAWSLQQAATVPVAYATAYYAIFVRGRARKGESILIHAAAGAVGQAALALCQHHGVAAFATCSRDKRPALMKLFPALPDHRIANSRDTSFEQVILRETRGAGVDLVLNSLAGEQLQASLRCLREGGRFLEIGKLDLSQDSKLGMSIFLKNVTFHGILLDALFEGGAETGPEAAEVMRCMTEGLQSGAVQPLPATAFSHNQLEEAFRYMATGKHIGKVVLKVREEEAPPPGGPKALLPAVPQTYMHPEKTYVLVGGMGGFGLELAGWLVKRGATRLVLVSRSGVTTGYQAWCIRRWRSAGVKVLISKTDATTEAGAMALMKEAEALGPVGGVFNLAAVLRDAFLDNQTTEAFRDVARPKIDATEALDAATRALCPALEHFVAFSSVSCGRGNAGQTNYGLANSAMERVCERRAALSLPALCVQWGAIGDVGLVMSMSGSEREDMTVGGTVPQRIASCLAALGSLMGQPWPVASSLVLPDRRRAHAHTTQDIRKQVANILGLKDPDKVNESASLAELGMDSLMGAEIKQALERAHDVVLGVPEVRALTFAGLRALQAAAAAAPTAGSGAASPPGPPAAAPAAGPGGGEGPVPQFALLERLMPTEPVVHLPSAKPDSKNIVFMVGGVEGTADGLERVSARVAGRVAALQCTRAAPLHALAALAAHYCRLVRALAPPPYVLLGYSYGASVAFEMAAQFEKEGCGVSLTLVDGSPAYVSAHTLRRRRSRGERADTPRDHADALAYFTALFSTHHADKLSSSLEALENWEQRLARATELVCAASGLEEAAVAAAATAFYRKLASALEYKCSHKLACPVSLFVAERARAGLPADYGLQEHCRRTLALHPLAATHASILQPPHAHVIANHLNATLTQLNGAS